MHWFVCHLLWRHGFLEQPYRDGAGQPPNPISRPPRSQHTHAHTHGVNTTFQCAGDAVPAVVWTLVWSWGGGGTGHPCCCRFPSVATKRSSVGAQCGCRTTTHNRIRVAPVVSATHCTSLRCCAWGICYAAWACHGPARARHAPKPQHQICSTIGRGTTPPAAD